jgi:superfamily II DNA/RNA helicase
MFEKLNIYTKLSVCLIIGQSAMDRQESDMRKGPDLVIATPGRLIDLLTNSRNLDLDDLEMLVFDEADKLLDLGFKGEIEKIVEIVGQKRQTMLFSATLDSGIK